MVSFEYLLPHSVLNRRFFCILKEFILPEDLILIKKKLMFKPKTHIDFSKFVVPIKTYSENDKYLMVPRFWGLENIGKPKEKYGKVHKIDIQANFELREYQKEAYTAVETNVLKNGGSTLNVGCGYGKTALALYMTARLKTKTLIIVHTTVLLNQWIERIKQFIKSPKIGIIKGNVFDVEDKTHVIAMVQTLVSKTKNFTKADFKDFGFTIFDEVHHMSAPGFSNAFSVIGTRYLLGLTATPCREDGLQDIFLNNIGNIDFSDDSGGRIKGTVISNLISYSSDLYSEKKNWKGSPDMHKMLEQIISNNYRNMFINKLIKSILKEDKRQILVLSTRIKHLKDLKELFDKKSTSSHTSSLYIGGMKTEELEKASKANVLFATYQLVSEGTDIPTLNSIILTTPKKNVQQVIGRIMRGYTDLNPLIFDIIDDFGVFKNQSRIRKRFYKKNNYEIFSHKIINDAILDFDYTLSSCSKEYEDKKLINDSKKKETIFGFTSDDI